MAFSSNTDAGGREIIAAVEKEKNLITKAEELCKIIEEKLYIMKEEID